MYSVELFIKALQATRKHKAPSGHANAKFEYRASNGMRLGRWQYRIRKRHQSGGLSPEQISLLQELGFNFDPAEKTKKLRRGLDEFIAYRQRSHSPNIPRDYRTPTGYRLGLWQQNTRPRCRKGRLTGDAGKATCDAFTGKAACRRTASSGSPRLASSDT